MYFIFTLNVLVKKDFCTKMNDTEVEDLLAFLMNKISKYVNGGSSDIALNMNDRIFILCIQTIGVLMSSYCLHVKSKVCNFPPFMNALFFGMCYVEKRYLMSLCVSLRRITIFSYFVFEFTHFSVISEPKFIDL